MPDLGIRPALPAGAHLLVRGPAGRDPVRRQPDREPRVRGHATRSPARWPIAAPFVIAAIASTPRDPLGRRRHRPLRRAAARLRQRDPGRAADPGGLGRPVHRGAAAAAARSGRRPRQRPAGGGRAAAADRGHARHVPDPRRLEPARDARADRRGPGLAGRLPRLLRAGAGRADPDAGPRRHLDPADAHAVLPGAHVRRRRRAGVVLGRRQRHRRPHRRLRAVAACSPPSPAWP